MLVFLYKEIENMANVNYCLEGTFDISFLKAVGENQLTFANEVDNIYQAYRTCYSDKPIVVDKRLVKKDKLKAAFIEHLQKVQFTDCVFDEEGSDHAISWYPEGHTRANKLTVKNFKTRASAFVDDLAKKYGEEAFYQYLYKCWFINAHKNHESPIEHAILTYQVGGCSRALTHQLVRHRIASYSQASQRYISENKKTIDLILPTEVSKNKEARKIVTDYLDQLPGIIAKLNKLGVKNEDIRCVYPNAMSTNIVVSMNFRELMHFFSLRMDKHAQAEIRELATVVWRYIAMEVPFVFDDFLELVKRG